jgi:thermitase
MRRPHRIAAAQLTAILTAVLAGVALGGPAGAAAQDPATAAGEVALVVGLRPGADPRIPAARLEAATTVDVVASDRVAGVPAVTLDVPADDAARAAAALRADPAVRYVEPERRAHAATVTSNDDYRSLQWGLDRVGVPGAWQRTTGSASITVAVVDTGVDEVSDISGAVLAGHDFVNDDSDPADDEGHGTEVASVIAARGNNGAHVAGVCWSCKILPVKVLGSDGGGDYSDIAAGITWAADHGADIINLSLGGPDDSQLMRDAVDHAVDAGALVVAAAGNDGVTDREYPAAIEPVLAVGASGVADTRYEWSNYGADWVDVAAPGCNPAQGTDGGVYDFCGTSSATPMVAGIAALVLAGDPTSTATQLRTALTSTAAPLAGNWVANGRVNALRAVQSRTPAGYGAPSVSVSAPAANAYVRGSIAVTASASDSGGSVSGVTLLANGVVVGTDTTAPYSVTWNSAGAPRRSALTMVAVDNVGHTAAADVAVVADNTAPTVSVTTPVYLAKVRGQVTVAATAADPSGITKVEVIVGGKVVRTDATAPFAPVWDSTGVNGKTDLIVRAYDRAGNTAVAHRGVIADNTAPTVGFRSGPANGAHVSGTVYIGADAGDTYGVRRVQLLVGSTVVATDTTSPFSFALSTANRPSTMVVRLRAYDMAGNARLSTGRTYYR